MSKYQIDIAYNQTDFKILNIITGKISNTMEKIQLHNELNIKSQIDPITKIYNYRLLSESLDREIERYKREKREFFVYMMDIDDFKSYNDVFGHLEGDELLTNFGKILNEQVRKTDIVCRYAGDEFCIILSNTTLEGAITPAEKIIKAVEAFEFKRVVTVSIGIAGYKEGMTKKDIIGKADKALYEAKHKGKNQVVVSS
jgi:diguanylate cyclase (GGDEF)-like protein